jgi:hypothetical protein
MLSEAANWSPEASRQSKLNEARRDEICVPGGRNLVGEAVG